MPRKTSVSYWPTRKGGGYFCIYKGTRHELALGPDDQPDGPTYMAALTKFQAVIKGEAEKEAERAAPKPATVREVLEAYMRHIAKTRSAGTLDMRQRAFDPFVNHRPAEASKMLGEKPAPRLTHKDVYDFLEHMETVPRPHRPRKDKVKQTRRKPVTWGPGSQRNALQGLTAGFNWAARSGMIPKSPLAGIEMPSATSRGAESLIGNNAEEIEANHKKVLAAVPSWYRPLIQALKDTGARPGELIASTAADFNPDTGAIVFHKTMTRRRERFSHKTAKVKDRVIFLTGETLEHVRRLSAEHPTGPLFRRKGNKPFKRFHVIDRFVKLQRKLKMPDLTAYSYRHTYATELLKVGMDVETLAELMGNSAMVIRQHYSHLLADAKGLREKLERFKSAAAGK